MPCTVLGFPRWLSGYESACKQKTWVQSLGQEDPWRRKCQPTPVLLLGKSHEQRSLAVYSTWGVTKELDTTKRLNNSSTVLSARTTTGNKQGRHSFHPQEAYSIFKDTKNQSTGIMAGKLG